MPHLITIRRFRDLHEALLAQSKLESADIASMLVNAETIRTDWLYSNAVGGIRLQVKDEDAEAARALLDEPIPESLTDDLTAVAYEQPHCPQCGSLDIEYGPRKDVAILSWLALGFPLPIHGRKRWKCSHCSAEWIEVPDEDPHALGPDANQGTEAE